jgi:hypothetical protein
MVFFVVPANGFENDFYRNMPFWVFVSVNSCDDVSLFSRVAANHLVSGQLFANWQLSPPHLPSLPIRPIVPIAAPVAISAPVVLITASPSFPKAYPLRFLRVRFAPLLDVFLPYALRFLKVS